MKTAINELYSVMSTRTDRELIDIVSISRGDYQLEAIKAAEIELSKRNINPDTIENIKKEIYNDIKLRKIRAEEPLQTYWKILTFIFPGILNLFFAFIFTADGYNNRTKEMWKWTAYGFCFYIVMILLIQMFY